MKKLFISFFALAAIAGFGGNILRANAQSLPSGDTVSLQATVNALTARVNELKAQAAARATREVSATVVAATPATAHVLTLSRDTEPLKSALSLSASALADANAKIATDPAAVAGQEKEVAATLSGIGKTLGSIKYALNGAGPSASIAMAAPQGSLTPLVVAADPAVATPVAVVAAERPLASGDLAQASAALPLKNLNWPFIIVMVVLLAAVGLWLFWPAKAESVKEEAVKKDPVPANGANENPQTS